MDLALSTKSKEAFPEDTQAAEMWDKYVQAQCPRLRAGMTLSHSLLTHDVI